MKRRRTWWTAAVMLALWAGCRTPSPEPLPFTAPPLSTEVYYFTGTPLSGPMGVPGDPGKAEDALEMKATLFALEQPSKAVFETMASRTRLVVILRDNSPLLPVSVLTRGARLGTPKDAKTFINRVERGEFGPSAPIGELFAVLPRGISTVFKVADAGPPELDRSGQPVEQCIEILFRRVSKDGKENKIEVAFNAVHLIDTLTETGGSEGDVERDAAGSDSRSRSPQQDPRILHREILLLDDLADPNRGCLVFFINTLAKIERTRALAAVIELAPFSPEDPKTKIRFAEASARCREDLERFEKEVGARSSDMLGGTVPGETVPRGAAESGVPSHEAVPSGAAEWTAVKDALSALKKPGMQRRALVSLARSTDAVFTEDLALSAQDAIIAEVAASSLKTDHPADEIRAADLGFHLEKEAYSLVLKRIVDQTITMDLEGKIACHTGEVGRHPLVLSDIIHKAAGIEDLNNRLLYENFLFLNSYNPAARVRAFDWLSARRSEMEGYHPLAPESERREALARVLESLKDPSRGSTVHE